jgi:5-methylthioadenosine/S-adenosylhomocysteine deaminase
LPNKNPIRRKRETAKSSEKLLLKNGFLITCNDTFSIYEKGSVVVENGKILEANRSDRITTRESKIDEIIDANGQVILPGFVSLHFHSDNLSRGVGEHMGLEEWLDKIYYPILAAMKPHHVRVASSLAYLEAIKSGTTCVNDMYKDLTQCAKSAEDIGIRAVLSSEAADLVEGQETIEDNERAFREKHNAANGRIKIWFGAEWVPVCSPELLARVREFANRYDTGIHIHLNESKAEVKMCKEKYGLPPIKYVHKLGLLGSDVVAAHCVWVEDDEMKILAETGTHVSYNPISNMKLGNGIARVSEMIDHGINVGLGPDDAPCNNTVDMFEVMKFASLGQKARLLDASQMRSELVIRMATRNGANALDLGNEIGSIEPGKKADLITINLRSPRLTPVILGKNCNVTTHIVFSAHGEDVSNVIIDGNVVMRDRHVLTVDEPELIDEANKASEELLRATIE